MNKQKQDNKIKIFLLVITAAVLGGGAGVFSKIALREIPPFSFTFLRFLIASIFLLPFSLKYLTRFRKSDYQIILLSLLASINVILFSFGIKYTSADMSQMIYVAVPIISAVFSFYLLKERFSFKKILGILLGFVGAILIIILPLLAHNQSSGTIYGNLIISLAAISISLYWVLSKKFQSQYSPLEINNYFIFTTTVLLLFLSFFDLAKTPSWWQGVSLVAYLSLAFVAILSTAVYYFISQILIKKATPVVASMVLNIQPFVTFIFAYYLLSETLSLLFIVGIVITLAGVWLVNTYQKPLN
ncbi:MAG: DMT family transporter [Patescibacteria group bacterium]|jgi:drug/metabolite transporter (DMT)-like permease